LIETLDWESADGVQLAAGVVVGDPVVWGDQDVSVTVGKGVAVGIILFEGQFTCYSVSCSISTKKNIWDTFKEKV